MGFNMPEDAVTYEEKDFSAVCIPKESHMKMIFFKLTNGKTWTHQDYKTERRRHAK